MTEQTRMMISTAVKCDKTITADERRAVEALLEGRRDEPEAEQVIPVTEVARRLHKTPKTIHLYCKQGLLKKAAVGKQSRAIGVLASSLEALISGGAA